MYISLVKKESRANDRPQNRQFQCLEFLRELPDSRVCISDHYIRPSTIGMFLAPDWYSNIFFYL